MDEAAMDKARFTANCSILFTELPLLERPRAAADAGFGAIELWWPFESATPSNAEIATFIDAFGDGDVRLSGLNFFAGDMAAGERGILSAPARGEQFIANIERVRAISEALDCHCFNVLYGNRLSGEAPDSQDATALARLDELASFCAETQSVLVLEPLSGVAEYPLKNFADAAGVIARLSESGSGAEVKVLADLYHLAVNGDDVSGAIRWHAGEIGHVQIADAPGRNEPGTGELPIARWLEELVEAGYPGLVGLEYRPSTSTAESLGWLAVLS